MVNTNWCFWNKVFFGKLKAFKKELLVLWTARLFICSLENLSHGWILCGTSSKVCSIVHICIHSNLFNCTKKWHQIKCKGIWYTEFCMTWYNWEFSPNGNKAQSLFPFRPRRTVYIQLFSISFPMSIEEYDMSRRKKKLTKCIFFILWWEYFKSEMKFI